MKLKLTDEERSALLKYLAESEDCEKLGEGEWVADLYDIETPASLNLVFRKGSVFADGAEYLAYDVDAKGFYLSGPVESAEQAKALLRAAGALSQ